MRCFLGDNIRFRVFFSTDELPQKASSKRVDLGSILDVCVLFVISIGSRTQVFCTTEAHHKTETKVIVLCLPSETVLVIMGTRVAMRSRETGQSKISSF